MTGGPGESRRAVVTGAASGLGREIARALAAEGRGLVLVDRDAEGVHATADEIATPPSRRPEVHVADLASGDDVATLGRELATGGRLDALVNNAGGWLDGPQFPEASPEAWQRALALNLLAPMALMQALWGPLGGGGAVVNVGSAAGAGDEPYGSPEYGAAKAALRRLTTSLADRSDVRVMAVVPDWIALDRAIEQWAALSVAERRAAGGLVPVADVVAAVVRLIDVGRPGEVVDLPGTWVPDSA